MTDEAARLAALDSYKVLDTGAERVFDDLVMVAAQVCEVPIALVSLVDADRQWFKARLGLDICSTGREVAFCSYALTLGPRELLEVKDAQRDARFASNPLVTGDPYVRFYAGAPLVTPGGLVLGTLCVIDTVPRTLDDAQRQSLIALAGQVMGQLELRRQTALLAEQIRLQESSAAALVVARDALRERQAFADAVLENVKTGIVACDASGHLTLFNAASRAWHGIDADDALGPSRFAEHYSLFEADGVTPLAEGRIPLLRALRDGQVRDAEIVIAPHGLPVTRVICAGARFLDARGETHGAVVAMHDVTALRDRERERAAAAAHLEAVLEAATEHSVIATDAGGLIVTFNEGAERMLGFKAGELVGLETPAVIHDSDEIAARAADLGIEPGFEVFAAVARQGDHETREWTYVRRNGTRLAVRLTVTAMRDSDGLIIGFIGIAVDITTEKAALRALEAAEARWRVLLDHLPDTSVLVVDADFRYQVAVGAGLSRQGMADLAGKTLFETSSPANVDLLAAVYRSAFEGREESVEVISTNGHRVTEIVATPLPGTGPSGESEALVVARDISAARAREDRLRRTEERARRLFADAPHGIVVFALDGTIRQANEALARMLGRELDSMSGRPLVIEGNVTVMNGVIAAVLASPTGRFQGEVQLRHIDGHFIDVSCDCIRFSGTSEDSHDEILINAVDVSERRRYEAQLAHLADHDPLTGLANRRRFDAELIAHLERCRRYGPRGALLMLDLDHFKEINDTLGHSVGDQLIVSAAALLRSRLRTTDVVARLGGDEFAVLLPEADRTAAETVAADLVDIIRTKSGVLDGTRSRTVTTSVGLVLIDKTELTAAELMSTADLTMYDAKDAGRDRYTILDTARYGKPRRRAQLEWADRINDALQSNGLVLYAQPILELATGKVNGAEVLVRMVGDGGQLVAPGRFLYIAERLGLATQIDTWVADQAIDLLEAIHITNPTFRLEVNLSGHSVGNPHLAAHLVERIKAAAIHPEQLVFEITETAAVANIETARTFAETIAEVGCRFALDDFGAGFGSFYYLKHLPFDYVKIDGEFVTKCVSNPTDRVILSSIVGIAKGLGKQTIAEYVADAEILDLVRKLGVDYAQGYYIGRPAAIADIFA